jgi:hypothetical protein
LEAVFILLEFPSSSRRIFIGSHSLPPPLSGSPYRSFKDELALLTRRFERLHENRVNRRRNTRTCFQCGKPGHFVADCPEKGQEQGRLQAQVKDGWQVLVEA